MDEYDRAIAYLTAHPDEIPDAWFVPEPGDDSSTAKSHCLFRYASEDGTGSSRCGCLTQIRLGTKLACTDDLTERIRNDDRLPRSGFEIKVADLSAFAEWQRLLDAELGRRIGTGALVESQPNEK